MKVFKKDSEKTRLFNKSAKDLQEYDPIGNCFKMTCLASCCKNVVIYAPIVFVACLVIWSYFAYVVCFCILVIPQDAVVLRAILLVFYHVLLLMFAWTYAACIVTPAATIPFEYWLKADEVAELAKGKAYKRDLFERIVRERGLACDMRTIDGLVRHCEVCQMIKPDRTHHCSVCRRCVPKMDHHCPWVANCVGFHNYKHFMLLLLYTSVFCAFQCFSSLPFVFEFLVISPFVNSFAQYNLVVLFFLALVIFITVISLFLYHVYLILSNRSTLEASRAPIFVQSANPCRDATFNHGALSNMREVCGERFCCWLLPIATSIGDGFTYAPSITHITTSSSSSTGPDVSSSCAITAAQSST